MSAFFVTATGTDIGKTFVSAAILSAAVSTGKSVGVVKPLMSGFSLSQLENSDAGLLLTACGKTISPQTVDEVCQHRFDQPVSPHFAARDAGINLNLREICEFARTHLAKNNDLILVEGAGGVMSPVTDETTHLDLIAALDLPVILVTANYLGSISHTLTALESLDHRHIKIASIIVNEPTADSPPARELAEELTRWRPENVEFTRFSTTPDPKIGHSLLNSLLAIGG